eukprot:2393191-Pleurochrysis_carterae.AAC.1
MESAVPRALSQCASSAELRGCSGQSGSCASRACMLTAASLWATRRSRLCGGCCSLGARRAV